MRKKIICSLLLFLQLTSVIHSFDWPQLPQWPKSISEKIEKKEEQNKLAKALKSPFVAAKQQWDNLSWTQKDLIIRFSVMIIAVVVVTKLQEHLITQSESFKLHNAGTIKENFSNVAGNESAKKELADIVNYLKNPTEFQEIGARPPKGILLTGKPGTGKTLMARALAGEANCSFISCTGSDFDELYMGVGSKRVKELFKTARKNGPCIIFIDEIDTLASRRGNDFNGEHDKTINAFLTEMDGFTNRTNVLVIGATNNPNALDPAVVRAGRFDRLVEVPMPNVTSRGDILQVHLKKIKHNLTAEDIIKIANKTANFAGADLANLVNEAAIAAINKKIKSVNFTEFEESIEKILDQKETIAPDMFQIYQAGTIKENFSNVAGNHIAKQELGDIVNYLKNPESFKAIGAKPPKGILLTGEPGTGKTLLTKALAGEAKCSFIACSGSDFVDMYVGVGAERVRKLFSIAKKNKPCIIFIDEIDAVAGKRSSGGSGGDQEHNQTVNQLLSEMDGFTGRENIIVVATTNNPDLLDSAILRPGRFDRKIQVSMPDFTCREEILKVHLQKIQHDPKLDVKRIAQVTSGFSGADLAGLVNEAAIIALNKGNTLVTMANFEDARDKILLGSKHPTMQQSLQEKTVTAYHEAGHALILLLMPNQPNSLNKVTISAQGDTLGTTHFLAEQDKNSITEKELLAHLTMALGGRAAEELVFNEITTGASSDFEQASKIAHNMICKYGMTNILGKQVLTKTPEHYSQDTLKKIDEGITKILDTQYKIAMNILKTNRDKLDKLAKALLEKETLFAHEVYELLKIKPKQDFRIA